MISIYSLRTGIYYDGYFYGITKTNQLLRIDAEDRGSYVTIGEVSDHLTGMALDYTTGTVYGMTYDGDLVTIDLNTAEITKVGTTDAKVYAIAVDKRGVMYGAGSENSYTDGALYTIDKNTAACTKSCDLPCMIYSGPDYYGEIQYNSQLAYDFGTDRLYLNASSCSKMYKTYGGVFMIQLGADTLSPIDLDGISLELRGSIRKGDVYLGLMSFVPENSELPVHKVNGMIMEKEFGRVETGKTTKLVAQVRPSNANDTSLTWKSSDESIATVDNQGNVTGVSAGAVTITATSNENSEISATCEINVVTLTGEQSVAYTAVVDEDALYKFNPALPAQTAERIGTVNGKIAGIAQSKDGLYLGVIENGDVKLYSYSFETDEMTFLTRLITLGNLKGIAYDEVNNLLYCIDGFYILQYDLSKVDPNGGALWYAGYVMDADYATLNGIAVVDETVYYTGTNWDATSTMLMSYDKYFSTRTVISRDVGMNTLDEKTEMAYDSSIGKFYISDVMNNLYTMEIINGAEGSYDVEIEPIDKVGDGLTFSGLAIKAAAAE